MCIQRSCMFLFMWGKSHPVVCNRLMETQKRINKRDSSRISDRQEKVKRQVSISLSHLENISQLLDFVITSHLSKFKDQEALGRTKR